MKKRYGLLVAVLVIVLLLVSVVPSVAADNYKLLFTQLSGAEEVPGPGDPDGSGFAGVALLPQSSTVCVGVLVEGIATPTAAHIHKAPRGVAGPVVVPLKAPADGDSITCTVVSGELFNALWTNPSEYYVNVHNADYPPGAVRGQLG